MYELTQSQGMGQKQIQRLMMLPKMQQALSLLQAPLMEMHVLINHEVEQNPLLEYLEEIEESEESEPLEEKELDFDDETYNILQLLDEEYDDFYSESRSQLAHRTEEDEKKRLFYESMIVATPSLFDHLMEQVKEAFQGLDQEIAKAIVGNLDENGFLDLSLSELALTTGAKKEQIERVLRTVQSFTPTGIAAKDLQESLLIQMRTQNLEESVAYRVVSDHFDELLHNHQPKIAAKLRIPVDKLQEIVEKEIAALNFHPGKKVFAGDIAPIYPDAAIVEEEGELSIKLHEESLPQLMLNRKYLKMLRTGSVTPETKEFLLKKVESAKWLFHNIQHRNSTLHRILEKLIEKQHAFLLHSKGELTPLTMKSLSEELELHESTLARAVSHKYIETPRGTLPLKSFFTNAYETRDGVTLSSDTVRQMLKELIDREDKKRPLSDEKLSEALKQKGVACARRTVAKYRSQFGIGNTRQRRRF